MTQLDYAQNEYVGAAALVRAAGEEHARARVELIIARESGDADRIAIASMRSAYSTKLWESRLREEAGALRVYNTQLAAEVRRCRAEAAQLETVLDGGYTCSVPGY